MLSRILPRVWKIAFPDFDSGAAGLDVPEAPLDEDFHLAMKRKVYRVTRFLGDRSSRACIMSLVTEPLDWLWRRLQHMDESGSCLFDVSNARMDPFRKAQAAQGGLCLA